MRNDKNGYYAKSSAVEGVYKVPSDLGLSLSKGLDDFRTKKLFDLGFTDPDKIEMHEGSNSYYLTKGKGSSDWWLPDGKKADAISAETFEMRVRDLAANQIRGYGIHHAGDRIDRDLEQRKKRRESLDLKKRR